MPFIGEKEVKLSEKTEDTTPGGVPIIKVMYADGNVEMFSELMFEKIVTEEPQDLAKLRDARCQPVVAVILTVMREWGVKLGELGYISALLNNSLEFNKTNALAELFTKWMPRPLSIDDVDLVTIDRILKEHKPSINEILSNKPN